MEDLNHGKDFAKYVPSTLLEVSCKLLKGHNRVIRISDFGCSSLDICGNADVSSKHFVKFLENLGQRAAYLFLVSYGIRKIGSIDS